MIMALLIYMVVFLNAGVPFKYKQQQHVLAAICAVFLRANVAYNKPELT